MKKILLLVLMLPVFTYAQKKAYNNTAAMSTVTGTVTYKVNDYVDNKVDVGAIVTFIPKCVLDSIAPNMKKEVKRLYDGIYSISVYNAFWNASSDRDLAYRVAKGHCREIGMEYLSQYETLDVAVELMKKNTIINNSDIERYETLIDANGSYTLKVPNGEYYVIFQSNNKKVDFIMLRDGIIDIEEITLLQNRIKRLSHNFEVEVFKRR